jgi:hypothetical protein
MRQSYPIKNFVRRYLTRSVIGVSVGLASLAPATASQTSDQQLDKAAGEKATVPSFGDRLLRVRAAASEVNSENEGSQLHLAQTTNWGSWSDYHGDAWEDSTTVARKTDK